MADNSRKNIKILRDRMTDLLNQLDEMDSLSNNQKKALASNIKKTYDLLKKELLISGIFFDGITLKLYINKIIDNYEKVKDLKSINMLMQEIAEDYKEYGQDIHISQENIEKRILLIYKTILGNPGTNIDGMSNEFIADIIRLKLTEKDGINRDDVLNLMMMQYKNMYDNIEEYQRLINSCVIDNFTYGRNGEIFKNPNILYILEHLASSYKVSGQFAKVKEIYEKALRMTHLAKFPEYDEVKKKYNEFLEFLKMREDFEDKRFDSFESLINSLEVTFTQSKIFKKGVQKPSPNPKPNPTPTPDSSYIMPVEDRLKGLKELVSALKKIDENYDITQCEIGQNRYSGYVIFKIDGSNVSIFENFNENEHARIFIVKNELIDQVIELSRNDARVKDGVEVVNHSSRFSNYCKNLIRRTLKLIKETSQEQDREKIEQVDESILPNHLDNGQSKEIKYKEDDHEEGENKDNVEPEIENDAPDQIEEENDINTPKDTESSTAEKADTKTDEEPKDLDPVEAERRKAHEQQKYLSELEAIIAANLEEIRRRQAEVEQIKKDLGQK